MDIKAAFFIVNYKGSVAGPIIIFIDFKLDAIDFFKKE